ncbi:hypothetical protein Tco_1217596 [Tanacetum coccineum]
MEIMYSPQFSKSFREDSPVEEVPTPKKKTNRRRQPARRRRRTEMSRNHGVFHGPQMKKLHCENLVFVYLKIVLRFVQHEGFRGGHFNLNTTIRDEEDEVHEVHPCRLMGMDQAKRKRKGATSSASSAADVNVEALAKLMVNEYAMVKDPYNVHKGQNLTELLEIKKKELKLKDGKLKI